MIPYSLTKDMDVGIIGEGEETICELFEIFENKRCFDKNNCKKINGIVYRENGKIHMTPKRKLINPLDKIPFPARDLFKIEAEYSTYMFTSRGCPYRCTFCASSRFWAKIRFFSAEYVVREIEQLIKEYHIKHIHLYDDLFIANIKRIEQIVRLLEENEILGQVTFHCSARANLLNEEIVRLLKRMGVINIGIGFESGCENTLKYLKAGAITVEDNKNAIKLIKKHKIEVHGSFIIGSPKETKEDVLETLNFIKKSQLDYFGVYVLTPFPGTPIWDYAKFKGLIDEKLDWGKLDIQFANNYSQAIILSEELTRGEIWHLFTLFQREQKRRDFYYAIKKGLQNP